MDERVHVLRVRMKEWPGSYGFVTLNWIAYKCGLWRMSPNCRVTPDSFSLLACLFPPLWASPSPVSPSCGSASGESREKPPLRSYSLTLDRTLRTKFRGLSESLRKFFEKRNKLTRLGIQRGSLARSKEYKGKTRDKGRDGERIPAVAGRISSNACLQGRKREPQLTRRKGQKAERYT